MTCHALESGSSPERCSSSGITMTGSLRSRSIKREGGREGDGGRGGGEEKDVNGE